jgi:hypothetical protein
MEKLMNEFLELLTTFFERVVAQTARQAPVILLALIAFIAGIYFARLAKAVVQRGLGFRRADPELSLLLGRVVQWGIIIFALLFATQQVGIDITAFLTGLGILGFTLGLCASRHQQKFCFGNTDVVAETFLARGHHRSIRVQWQGAGHYIARHSAAHWRRVARAHSQRRHLYQADRELFSPAP